MIQEQYVSFETAKLLKEKGFNEPCWFAFFEGELEPQYWFNHPHKNSEITKNKKDIISAPTQQMAMRWLREKHNYCINIILDGYVEGYEPMGYYISIDQYGAPYHEVSPTFIDRPDLVFFKTYEEAAEEAIKYVLQVLI